MTHALLRRAARCVAAALLAAIPREKRPQVYYARGPQGLTTGLGGAINVEMIELLGATNVYVSPHLPFGWFDYPPGANRRVELLWLSEILHPDLFRHDPRRGVAQFHKPFYRQEPTREQLDRLLGEPGVAPR